MGALVPAPEHQAGESGLADLTRPGQEDHPVRQILANHGLQRAGLHAPDLPQSRIWSTSFVMGEAR
jgi:hypothetical protein